MLLKMIAAGCCVPTKSTPLVSPVLSNTTVSPLKKVLALPPLSQLNVVASQADGLGAARPRQ